MLKRVFTLSDTSWRGSPTLRNMRWNDLLATTDWSDDDLDCIASMCCGETYTTAQGYQVKRQDS